MPRVVVAYEPTWKDDVISLSNLIDKSEYEVVLHPVERFPIGDTMILFLGNLSSQFDVAIIVIASEESLAWISRELYVQQHHLDSCRNIFPVFQAEGTIPNYWSAQNDKCLTLHAAANKSLRDWMDRHITKK